MAKQGRPPTAAEFQHWLKPAEALSRLPGEWHIRTKRDAILRRIEDGSLVVVARSASVQNRGEQTKHHDMAAINPDFWRDPWRRRDHAFWATGDLVFDDEPPIQLLYQWDAKPGDDEAQRIVTFKDLRIEPASFEREFAGHLKPDEPEAADFESWLTPKEALAAVPSDVEESQRRKWIMRRLREGQIVAAAERVTLADMQGERIVLNVTVDREYWGWREDGDWFASGDLDVTDAPEITSAGERVALDAWRYGPKKHGPTVHKTALFLGVRLDPAGFPSPKVKPPGGKPSAAEFEEWLHPVDVIEWYHEQGEREPKALIITLLSEGILQAAARQLVVNGKDLGIAPIPKEMWKAIGGSDWWQTQRFHMSTGAIGGPSISGFEVRIDPQLRTLPGPEEAKEAAPELALPSSPAPERPAKRRTRKKGGRPSGKHGLPMARLTKRLLRLPSHELATYTVEAVAAELIEEYRKLDVDPPHPDNALKDAAGVLRAVRDEEG
ncbi:MAG: hypothetical protein QOJ27_864 [Sphingomonadales bacterium]|nr:hypothetical protein [Sphingomonadales bacterium]